jgi:glutamine amidotransferase
MQAVPTRLAPIPALLCQSGSRMCELLGMSSSHATTVNLSLMKLAEHGGFSGPHRDGWGVAYYEGTDIRLIKEAESAADSDWVRFIGEHQLRSHLVMAHVRHATIGERAYRNTQPFMRELGGHMHLFAHNGDLPALKDTPGFAPQRFHPLGETDSEQAFCALLDRMTALWQCPGTIPPIEQRMACVVQFAERLRRLGPANFLYADGDALFAHGDRRKQAASGRVEAPGLRYLARRCRANEPALETSGVAIAGNDRQVIIMASVPLSDDSWQALAEGEVMAARDGHIRLRSRGRPGAIMASTKGDHP